MLSVKIGRVRKVLRERGSGFSWARLAWDAGLLFFAPWYLLLKKLRSRPEGEKEWEWRASGWVSGEYCIDFSREYNVSALLVGSSGSGKSTCARRLFHSLARRNAAVVFCDPHGEHSSIAGACAARVFSADKFSLSLFELEGRSPSSTAFETASLLRRVSGLGDVQGFYLMKAIRNAFASRGFIEGDRTTWRRKPPSLADVCAACDEMIALSKRVDPSLFSLKRRLDSLASSGVFASKTQLPFSVITSSPTILDLKCLRSSDAMALFVEVFLRKLYEFVQARDNSEPLIVLIDEAQAVCVGTREEPSFAGALVRQSRKFGLGLVFIAQSITALDPSIAANCACNLVFLTREPKDAEYAVGLLSGSRFSRKARLVEEGLNGLCQFECLASTSAQREVTRVRVTPLWEEGVQEVKGQELPFIAGSYRQRVFFEELQRLLPGERIVYSDRTVIPPFEIDLTLPEKKIAIEYDGAFYHSSEEQKKRDAEKEKLLAQKGWKLVRVVDDGLPLEEVKEKAREVASGDLGWAVSC